MNEISQAVRILRAGGLVAFPTETVYGLGADATNASAVKKIFAAKGRPNTNPLIAHVADEATAQRFSTMWPTIASKLAQHFWPGPLTLVVSKHPTIADLATAGRPTVALRVPDHPLALQLLKEFGGAVAAPSANRSKRVSPTTAQHVHEELAESVDLILDGGPCSVGIESTVLDLSTDVPTILRPGSVTREQIESQIGPVQAFAGSVAPATAAASPGQHAIHYAPRRPAFRFPRGRLDIVLKWALMNHGKRLAILHFDDSILPAEATGDHWLRLMPRSSNDYARELYAALRDGDNREGIDAILVEMPFEEPEWAAVTDRLVRATQPIIGQ